MVSSELLFNLLTMIITTRVQDKSYFVKLKLSETVIHVQPERTNEQQELINGQICNTVYATPGNTHNKYSL